MADEPVVPAAPSLPSAPSAPAAAPAPAPEPSAPSAPSAAPEPIAPVTPEPPAKTPSLLEQAGVEEPAKPGEVKPPEPAPEVKPPQRVYEPFVIPEGVQAPPEAMTAYTEMLGEHGIPQEAGQALLDRHFAEMNRFAQETVSDQWKKFADTQAEWVKQVKADEQLGGAGFQTTMQAIARMREMFVPADRREAFRQMLDLTGAGNHPEFLRFIHNVARRFDEPAPPSAEFRPTPDLGRKPTGGRRSAMYDHPTSHRERR